MSFQAYLDSLGGHQQGYMKDESIANQGEGNERYVYNSPSFSYGQHVPELQGQHVQWNQDGLNGFRTAPQPYGNDAYVDKSGGFLGFGSNADSLYANSPLLARQYQESIADGGLGAAQAEQLRLQNEQQRLAMEQARQAARQTDTPQYQGGNIMGLMQYQPQQQQAPQQQAPQQGLLGGGLHRPGFVANPGAANGQ